MLGTDPARRVVNLVVAGVIGGVAWWALRRWTAGEKTELDDVIWADRGRLSFRRSLGSGVISEIVIGLGVSLGREAAPKTMGGVFGNLIGHRVKLTRAQQRLLIACGGGAGLAAVYNVPLGGAFFTAEVLMGSVSIATILPALGCSWIATLVAWTYLPSHATYTMVPQYRVTLTIMIFAMVSGPIVGVLSAAYVRGVAWLANYRARGAWVIPAMIAAFTALGLIGIAYPRLFGNGKDIAHDAFLGQGGLALFLALGLLKPVVTGLCLGSGATGGLFTPTMSTGAALGAGLGLAWSQFWPGSPAGAYAMIAASAMIGAAMQAPLAGLALVLELTHSGFGVMVPMMAATVIATFVVRRIDGYSIYSARLPRARRGQRRPASRPEHRAVHLRRFATRRPIAVVAAWRRGTLPIT